MSGVEAGQVTRDNTVGHPPKVPPRRVVGSLGRHHRYSPQPSGAVHSSTHGQQSVKSTKREESCVLPPAVKPKPAGYRTYDALDDNEAQFPLPLPPRKELEQPPPLPSQPIPRHTPQQKSAISSGSPKTRQSPVSISQPKSSAIIPDDEGDLTLADFVKKYSQSLPVKVQVEEGYCGSEERFIISTGDVYNLHFIKNEKVMSIEDAGGSHFSTPINSDVQFGMLYNPVGDTAQAVKGYSFKTIGDLARYETHPRIVRATRAVDVGDSKSCIEADEILIIKKVGRTAIKRKHYVKVLSLRSREEKTLYEECEGLFLTDPNSVRLYLTDIVEHFSDCLPFKAMVFLNSDVTDESVSHLASEIVSLTHVSVVTSIIATTCLNGDAPDQQISELDYENDTPIAIPIELEISVHILRDQSEEERLYQCTRELFDNFDPTKIRNISGPSHSTHSGSLRQSVRMGYELRGLEILKPTRIYDVCEYAHGDDGEIRDSEFTSQGPNSTSTTHQQLVNVLQRKPAENSSAKASPLQAAFRQPYQKSASLDSSSKISCSVEEFKMSPFVEHQHEFDHTLSNSETYGNLSATSSPETKLGNEKQLLDLKSELKRMKSMISVLTNKYEEVHNEVVKLRKELNGYVAANGGKILSPACAQNVEDLRKLGHEQILKLLRIMNLEVYCQVFVKEQIDGEILALCDEQVLQRELDIASIIHRARLMKVISGKCSAIQILEQRSPSGTVSDKLIVYE